jgi:hypothetical protein
MKQPHSGISVSDLEAVLPLIPRDLERFALLARSLERFFPTLGRIHVVVPDRVHDAMKDRVRGALHGIAVEVVPEGRWVPDMASFRHLPGWYKHQLVKLAAAEFVASPYYLTLDADVICTRPMTVAELLPGGKSACFVIPKDWHPEWYKGAEAVLGLRAVRRGVVHNVTPVVWSKAGVLELIDHIEGVATRRAYARGARGLRQRLLFALQRLERPRHSRAWRAWLAASTPWSEYSMYFTLLEALGHFEQYHFQSDYCIYDVDRSVWWKADFDGWDAAPLFEGRGPPYFAVIQSNTHLPPALIWRKLSRWLGEPGDSSETD